MSFTQYKPVRTRLQRSELAVPGSNPSMFEKALKSDADGKAVVEEMKKLPTDDPLFGKGAIRADGRKIHPMYLFEVKKPSESKGPWDLYKIRATIPAAEAFRPLSQSDCPLVKK